MKSLCRCNFETCQYQRLSFPPLLSSCSPLLFQPKSPAGSRLKSSIVPSIPLGCLEGSPSEPCPAKTILRRFYCFLPVRSPGHQIFESIFPSELRTLFVFCHLHPHLLLSNDSSRLILFRIWIKVSSSPQTCLVSHDAIAPRVNPSEEAKGDRPPSGGVHRIRQRTPSTIWGSICRVQRQEAEENPGD
jgi:hypothetical protein